MSGYTCPDACTGMSKRGVLYPARVPRNDHVHVVIGSAKFFLPQSTGLERLGIHYCAGLSFLTQMWPNRDVFFENWLVVGLWLCISLCLWVSSLQVLFPGFASGQKLCALTLQNVLNSPKIIYSPRLRLCLNFLGTPKTSNKM